MRRWSVGHRVPLVDGDAGRASRPAQAATLLLPSAAQRTAVAAAGRASSLLDAS
jgi:hypothetical protein